MQTWLFIPRKTSSPLQQERSQDIPTVSFVNVRSVARKLVLPNGYNVLLLTTFELHKGKGKAIPLQAWTGREGSRRLRLQDFKTVGI